jgi:HAD superfamily hydrolase (TIGR01509 family)
MIKDSFFEYKAYLFDLDGLLFQTSELWRYGMKQVFSSYGFDITLDEAKSTKGMSQSEIIRHWLYSNKFDLAKIRDPKLFVSEVDDQVSMLVANSINNSKIKSGALEVVKHLCDSGKKIALVTSSPRSVALKAQAILDVEFDIVISNSDVTFSKPHPEPYLKACSHLGVDPNECLGFEDSINGLISLLAAKISSIWIPEETSSKDQHTCDILQTAKFASFIDLGCLLEII